MVHSLGSEVSDAIEAIDLARDAPGMRVGGEGDTMTAGEAARILRAHVDVGLCADPQCRYWVRYLVALVRQAVR